MGKVASIKENWLKKQISVLISQGKSKAMIAHELDMQPQQLNNILNGKGGISDKFLDKFTETFGINEIYLSSKNTDEKETWSEKLGHFLNKITGDTEMEADFRKEVYSRLRQIASKENIEVDNDPIWQQALKVSSYEVAYKWFRLLTKNSKLKYSYDWVLTGEGSMLRNNADLEPTPPGKTLPLIPYEAFAGYGDFQYSDMPIENFYTVNEFNTADFLIRVKGDSMYPKYNGGDILACKKIDEITFWQWNKVYAICTKNQGILIKRVREYKNNAAFITLVSENPKYQPFEIHEDEIVDVALVLGAIILE